MLRAIILRAALFCTVWWALSGGSFYAWYVGAITVTFAVIASLKLQPPNGQQIRLVQVPAFFLFFLAKSVAGGMQVAAMALRPRMQLRPAVLEMRLRLPHEPEQIFLASIISLLPGTLSAGLEGNLLQLHVLDSDMQIEQEVRDAESKVARLFGTRLS
jgi:multicomponent Na+:H+ antiporter subunit E